MATKVMNDEADLGIDPAAYAESTKRIRELNEKLMENAKNAGRSSLDAYEMALTSLVTFEQKVAGGSQLEWVSALANTHATFVSDVSSAYTKAARELIG